MTFRFGLTTVCLLMTFACSDYDLYRGNNVTPGGEGPSVDTSTPDIPYDTAEQNWCADQASDAEEVGIGDTCGTGETGGFNPIVEWSAGNQSCKALPVVADLNDDGMPEILVNEVGTLAGMTGATGKLTDTIKMDPALGGRSTPGWAMAVQAVGDGMGMAIS